MEARSLSSKGLKSQLIARLTKALKSEQEKEEQEAADQEDEEEEKEPEAEKEPEVDDKEEERKKREVSIRTLDIENSFILQCHLSVQLSKSLPG